MINQLIENSVKNIPDLGDKRRGRLLSIMLLGVAAIAIFSTATVFILETLNIIDKSLSIYTSTTSLFIGTFIVFFINQRGNVVLASTIFISLITFAISLADSPEELLAGRSLTFFIIPIMMSSFLFKSYSSFYAAAIITIEHLLLWNLEKGQIEFSIFGMVGFFLFALITWLAARSLEQALTEAREINQHLDELVGERTRELSEANTYLESANERLKELDTLKSKFVSDVSHELRTPVSNISIYLEMLENVLSNLGKTLPRKTLEFLKILRNETSRLSKLINDVLNTARLEQSVTQAEMQIIDINTILRDAVETNRLKAESKEISLSLNESNTAPNLLADPNQMKQVFINLIANAINYTPTGSITMTTRVEEEQIIFQIKDTGMGIADEDIEHLFDRFYRGKQASRSTIPGTGLGLSITKEIVEAHQGNIEVESELNVGTTFTITFPLHHLDK